ncbi:hypothetical protein ACP4OV_023574 [Aristida adscensionis]
MGSGYQSLLRRRVYAPPPLVSFPIPSPSRWIQFNEVGMEHIHDRWNVSAHVMWKGSEREYNGDCYIRLILVDREGTKIEALAFGHQCARFNSLLARGRSYDFIRVNFVPTESLPYNRLLYIRSDYYVGLSFNTMVYNRLREITIPICPRHFREFEDIAARLDKPFADIIGLVVYVSDIYSRENTGRRPFRHVALMNVRSKMLVLRLGCEQIARHINQWRRAASEFEIMAALHVRINFAKE